MGKALPFPQLQETGLATTGTSHPGWGWRCLGRSWNAGTARPSPPGAVRGGWPCTGPQRPPAAWSPGRLLSQPWWRASTAPAGVQHPPALLHPQEGLMGHPAGPSTLLRGYLRYPGGLTDPALPHPGREPTPQGIHQNHLRLHHQGLNPDPVYLSTHQKNPSPYLNRRLDLQYTNLGLL